ncbi:MAG: hypothetical protein ACREHC_01780, partial [Candidatus Levyibacteriota bacterium]
MNRGNADKIRNNNERSTRLILINELKTLRKGSGLTPRKLHQATGLRHVIGERLQVHTDALAIGQVFTYLLQEFNNLGENIEARATRNAFGIGWEHNPYNLIKRRTDFSQQLKRHPDTIKAYENQGIEEVALRLVNIMPLASSDYTDTSITHLTDTSTDARSQLATNVAQNMIMQGLRELYSLGAHAPEILKYFGDSQSPYLDTNIEWLLLPSKKGEDWCTYKLRYTFRGQLTSYRVGIVTNPMECELLMRSGLVQDVLILHHIQDIESEVSDLLKQSHFMFHEQETSSQYVLQ